MRLTSRSGRHSSKIELQMTSMIDVVFLLLIFFIVTSSFNKSERELDPGIKVQKTSQSQTTSDLQPAIIEIVRGGAGTFVFKLGGREITTARELTAILRQFDNKVDGAFVRPADNAPIRMAVDAMQACKDSGFHQFQYVPHDRAN